jgi:glycosyltransferase involved in cell wall biosynthesis
VRITQLTPGTGSFYCGSCLRDRDLAVALGRLGHEVTVIPLYLPLVLEDDDAPRGERVFMGGINMFLQQKWAGLRHLPRWLSGLLDAAPLLRWSAARSNMTSAAGHGDMVISMLRGEEGRQASELERLVEWIAAGEPPDVVVLSNALLAGMARRLKQRLARPILCTLQGEAPFLDALPPRLRAEAWETLSERAADLDGFMAVSGYYGSLMQQRLHLDPARVHVVPNGIALNGLPGSRGTALPAPAIGYLARMCPEKGLHTLVEAFIELKARARIDDLKLKVAGVVLRGDRAFVDSLRRRLEGSGCARDVEFMANIDRRHKLEFLRSISVLSVPATYGESFGLYVLEALAVGVPVVQPDHGAFPEIIGATGGGLICAPDDPLVLAQALEGLLLDEERRRLLGERGRQGVLERYTAERMAKDVERICMMVAPAPPGRDAASSPERG